MPVHKCIGSWPWTCLPLESVWRNTYLVVSRSGEGDGTPLQCSCLENPMDGGAWWAAVHGVAKSQTRLSDFTFTFPFHALEKAMTPHSSVLAWRIPWMAEPGRLQSMGSLRVGRDWATSLSCVGEGNGDPLQSSCLENTRDGGAWWASVYGVAQSRTRLKRLSSSSIYIYIHIFLVLFSIIGYHKILYIVLCAIQ